MTVLLSAVLVFTFACNSAIYIYTFLYIGFILPNWIVFYVDSGL